MPRQILVPLDGSELAEQVLPWVEQVARLMEADITLLQVVPSVTAADGGPAMLRAATASRAAVPDAEQHGVDHAHAYLVMIIQRLSHDGLTVHPLVEVGHPAEAIVRVAPAYALVAMATHGRGGVGRWVYGSVADKVLHAVQTPMLLVRAQTSPAVVGPPRHILVPLDGSELAKQVLPLVTALARRAGADLILLQSIGWAMLPLVEPYGAAFSTAALLDEAETGARAYLDQVTQRLAASGLAVQTAIETEAAAEAILDGVRERQADLIVMSTHGRSGVGRWMLGSVANRVLQKASVPVLLMRAGAPTYQPAVSQQTSEGDR